MGNIFDILFINPILNLLVLIYQGFIALHVPFALSLAIIALTVVIRLILSPFTAAQLRSAKKMQDIAPHLSNLKDKHKGDAQKLQQETMRLYKEHGVNPVAGCLPVLIQLPIIWALYTVLHKIVSLPADKVVGEVNKFLYNDAWNLQRPWDTQLLGISIAQSPLKIIESSGWVSFEALILLIPILTAVLQFIQTKMMMSPKPKTEVKKDKREPDFATAFQAQSLYIFPAMIGFFSFTLPIGLSLYWNTFTIFGILQQYKLQGWGGMAEWFKKEQPQIEAPAQLPAKTKKKK